jgi:UDPglucose--hexose-1-phosphate uridylyltransferase
MSQWRQNLVTGRWVIVAPARADRPHDLARAPEAVSDPSRCPFCPGHEADAGEELQRLSGQDGAWRLRVLRNKFPVLALGGSVERRHSEGHEWLEGVGEHEVVIDSPDHERSFAELPVAQAEDVFRTYQARIRALAGDPRIAYVQVFRNEGAAAGASLRHPHSQIIATPVVPPSIKEEFHGALRWRAAHGGCVYCHLLASERGGPRWLWEDGHFAVWAPYASAFAWELLVLPKDHVRDFHLADEATVAGLAAAVRRAVRALKRKLGPLPYNYYIHSAPLRLPEADRHFHWHLRIIPRLSQPAGFEWSTGFAINSVAPEEAAGALRALPAD